MATPPVSESAAPAVDDQRLHAALARLARLAASGNDAAAGVAEDALESALARIAAALGVPAVGGRRREGESMSARVERLAAGMGLAVRHVTLRSGWSTSDAGPLLGFGHDDQPLALLPAGGGYRCFDPQRASEGWVTREDDLELAAHAICFYRRLPPRALRLHELLAIGLGGMRRDLATLLGCAAAGGLLGLAVPVATALVFDEIVPGHMRGLLHQIGAAIVILAILQLTMTLANGVAMLRIESKAKLALQAATIDRLIHLPAGFFRNYSSGDLGQRTLAVETISSMITGSVASSLFAGTFSIFGFALLFYYHAPAALVAVGLSLVLALVAAVAGWLSLRALRDRERLSGRLSGMVLEMLNGIERIRLAGAESRIFSRWAHCYADMREHAYRAQKVSAVFSAFSAGYRVLALGTIFAAVAWLGGGPSTDSRLGAGAFFAFISAFGTAFMALSQLTTTAVDLLAIGPIWERLRPIIDTPPEAARGGADPGMLAGAVAIGNLHFRYAEGQPNVLRGVNLRANPGEFVAIVGASGCGKSTLFRLLLGFETPAAGAIYIDGHELGSLDIRAVRRQIGTVLQHDTLIAGSIFENIRGARDITVDDAWAAARLAGIAGSIEALPMGMHTMIGDNPGFSGGELQRLLIARALAAKPRILLFDEATSALDNRAQAVVAENLVRLTVTRLVIAHRLSTIEAADRIYVLDDGIVVEEGRYGELLEANGPFARLVHKQLM